MKNTYKFYTLLFAIAFICSTVTILAQKPFVVQSPDGKLKVNVSVGNIIEYSLEHDGDLILKKSPISMTLTNGTSFGVNSKLSGSSTKTINQTISASIYKKKEITDNYNELNLMFKEGFNIIFRAYNDGIAYRFVSNLKKPFEVKEEQAIFNFPKDEKAYIPYVQIVKEPLEKQFYNSFENTYQHINISQWDKKRLAFLPLVVEAPKGKKICITEADLTSYPGMYLYNSDGSNNLTGVFAPYPKEIKQGGHNMLQSEVQSHEPYIAKCNDATNFPWRTLIVSENDHDLADNDMVYKLATPNKVTDISWIKPGKVAWDWWNDWNLFNVNFKSGINNDTYKYYIDFASEHGIEYVILDEGWAVNLQADLYQVVPAIDLKELVNHANKKNVGLILWAGYYAFNKDIEGICKHYSEMGIKGFKVDFMDRDDQPMVDFHYRAAEIAAKHHMLLDYHGTYKPTGLQRTFPNVINFEGVHGLEQMKWSPESVDQVTYDVTIPFIRMVAGPMDYTQGAMRNASKGNYRPVNSEPMSQGTRCRQLAEYIIFESPLNMLCDNPSNYMLEKECTEFIANVPTIWDNTIALNGKIGEYITIARKKDNIWYVGSLTNWDARTLDIDLSFLGEGNYKAEVFKDGINANRSGHDYKKEVIDIPTNRKLQLPMASAGGYVMKIYK
ncbi:glycoside hydrolase family 97 protein [Dysgonomonas sp. GY617]|uniref:glycoside hydrolase family 97 protein n=1 Tax=Dysgonomonas sp. GY617 TaxID=2780420 RepID=UPI0018833D85|nr:glycoside hydrolase family 97 protein [Dysgonomonas sp. GY617]MBF0578053.1 glycoside hydrolase family 97 protein [Dysgonomonas sp. GY617]